MVGEDGQAFDTPQNREVADVAGVDGAPDRRPAACLHSQGGFQSLCDAQSGRHVLVGAEPDHSAGFAVPLQQQSRSVNRGLPGTVVGQPSPVQV